MASVPSYREHTLDQEGQTAIFVLDTTTNPFSVTVGGIVSSGGVLEYNCYVTINILNDPSDVTYRIPLSKMTNLVTSSVTNIIVPVTAVVVELTSVTSGELRVIVMQSGGRPINMGPTPSATWVV